MAASPRKRLLSPRKRLPPAPFNQTWHETDTAHLDPSALPVARVPRAWERKREVKQLSEGRAKSIWRRFNLRSSTASAQQEEETDEDEHEAHARAVKRRQRMSPKAMEKMHASKRAFQGTRWDRRKSVLPRKRSANNDNILHEEQSDSDDSQDATDADGNHEILEDVTAISEGPSSFTLGVNTAEPADELLDPESLDEQDDDQKLGSIIAEDSTFALIFRSPVKGTSPLMSTSPAKVGYPALPNTGAYEDQQESSPEPLSDEDITVTGPTVESVVAEVVANVPTSTTYISEDDIAISTRRGGDIDGLNAAEGEGPDEVAYPDLPPESAPNEQDSTRTNHAEIEDEDEDAEMSEVDLAAFKTATESAGNTADEEITEASLQFDIQEEYEREGELASQPPTPKPAANSLVDITDGLTLALTPAQASSREHAPRKLHSPPPPLRIESGPDDATMTLAIDDDTAILKSFLSRAAASKAERSAIITRRSSLENRRDSDIVRHALASPRKVLEEKDPNSPTKIDTEATSDVTDVSTPTLETEDMASPAQEQPEGEDNAEARSGRGSRRSSRAKKSRLPAPATAAQPQTNKIAIRRADGTDPVVLKKTDAQELALITRNNTRKNKQGAFMVSLRLLRIQAEAILSPQVEVEADAERPPVPGRRGIRWDETLAYYQEHADTIAAQQAEAESLATPDELSLSVAAAKIPKVKAGPDQNSTPKVRRIRGLGTANGTPGKGLLATESLLLDVVQGEKTAAAQTAPTATAKGIPKPKTTKRLPVPPSEKLAPLDLKPVGIEPPKERKSRIAPPSVRLPKPVTPVAPIAKAEKENARSVISAATPRKGIPAPRIVAPKAVAATAPATALGMESGLPRRRGRKV